MNDNKWLIVWYDCCQEDNNGNIRSEEYLPYRISCAYLDLFWSNWKYVKFKSRGGVVDEWKRSEWYGKPLDLDFKFDDDSTSKHHKNLIGLRVSDLPDITPDLAKQDERGFRSTKARVNDNLSKIAKWRTQGG